jgi:hypothetical protein
MGLRAVGLTSAGAELMRFNQSQMLTPVKQSRAVAARYVDTHE